MTEPSSAEASRDLARDTAGIAKCRRQPSGSYTSLYLGTQRLPDAWQEDETGAVAVIECIAGGRIAICTTEDRQWMQVKTLP